MNADRVLILGSGAMACLFAARLAAAGFEVALLGSWQSGLEALSQHGVRLTSLDGRQSVYRVFATADPSQVRGARVAIVLVKSWQTKRAAEQLQSCLAAEGVALTLQNGWGNREILSEVLGAERVALGVTTVGATLLAPGVVRQAGEGKIWLGEHPRLKSLMACFEQAGFDLEVSPNPEGLLWGKLVINAAINPLTALLGVPNGQLLSRPTARALLHRAAEEAVAVAKAQGITLPYADAIETVESIAWRTAENLSSMLQDVRRGAPTEIDAICGVLVRMGQQKGISTPTLETLWHLVRALAEAPDARLEQEDYRQPSAAEY